MNVKEIGKGILAVTITVLVFHSIGLLPNSFWNILATLGVMTIYVKNYQDVEGFLIYTFFFLSILGLLGIFDATFNGNKEGFYVNNMKFVIEKGDGFSKKTTFSIPSRGMYKYAKPREKREYSTTLTIESNLYLARPVVFKHMPTSFDVFHG